VLPQVLHPFRMRDAEACFPVVENARVFDTVGIRSLNEIRAPLQGANDAWVGIMFQGACL